MEKTKYTFLLPAYKVKYLDEMLRSIKNQTFTDYKVVISDDCSPEPIKEVCMSYLTDSRFSYRRNAENMGGKSLVAHWNLLVDMCDTEFLIMASDDDIYSPHFLEEVDKLHRKYPKVDLIRARVLSIDEEGQAIIDDAMYKECVDNTGFTYQKHFNNALRCIANCVFRTDVLKAKGGFVEFPLAWYSDDATVMMMAENGVANTADCLFSFRSSTSNISSRKLTHRDAFLKARATQLFDEWFYTHIEKSRKNSNMVVNYQLSFAKGVHDRFMHEQFSYMSSNCAIADFLKLLSFYPSVRKKLKLLYRYLRAQMK